MEKATLTKNASRTAAVGPGLPSRVVAFFKARSATRPREVISLSENRARPPEISRRPSFDGETPTKIVFRLPNAFPLPPGSRPSVSVFVAVVTLVIASTLPFSSSASIRFVVVVVVSLGPDKVHRLNAIPCNFARRRVRRRTPRTSLPRGHFFPAVEFIGGAERNSEFSPAENRGSSREVVVLLFRAILACGRRTSDFSSTITRRG